MIPLTLVEMLRRGVDSDPDARLFQCGGPWRSYGQVEQDSDLSAAVLAGVGVRRGDRVATLATNRDELIDLMLACAKLGAIQVPLNPYLKGEFLRHQLSDCGTEVLAVDAQGIATVSPVLTATSVTTLVCLDDLPEGSEVPRGIRPVEYAVAVRQAGPVATVAPGLDDIFSIMYTSGTTGLPKGCVISHGYLGNSPRQWTDAGWLRPADIQFTALPLFHTGGQNVVVGALVAQAPAVLEPHFSASGFIARAAGERATLLRGVGSMAMAILRQPERRDDAGHGFRQGGFPPLTSENQHRFERRFGLRIDNQLYGQTECIPATIAGRGVAPRAGSCGKPAPTVELQLVDDRDEPVPAGGVGEIVVRPVDRYGLFSGYWNNPEATLEAWRGLWHHTGDYGRMDEDGYVYFVDRKKDALRRRGENVSSMEVEGAIRNHPAVVNAAVLAVPSEVEDDIKVLVVLDDAVARPSPADFFDFLKANLPYFAMPRWVVVVDELPVTQTGRIQKNLLRDHRYDARAEWDFEALGLLVTADERRAPARVARPA